MLEACRGFALAVCVAAFGVTPEASANPGPEGDDVFNSAPMPASSQPDDRLTVGVGLLSGGIMSFVIGATLQRVWAVEPCFDAIEFSATECGRPPGVKAVGVMGIVMMAAGVGMTIPGGIITHRARRKIAARQATLDAVVGPRFVGLTGRF